MTDSTVLVAGGTRGIGLAAGLAFASRGATVVLTHRWGSADPDALVETFAAAGCRPPVIVEADVADPESTEALFDQIGRPVDVLVANVCVAARGQGRFAARALRQSLSRSAWPVVRYVDAHHTRWGEAPTHVLATSSDGHDHFYPGYGYVAASKSLLEALCVELDVAHPASRVNVVRARQVDTASFRDMFPNASREQIARFADFDLVPQEVADVLVALTEPGMAGVSGQVVVVDRGATALDNLVNVVPRFLGTKAPWETDVRIPGAPPGRVWVDCGVVPGSGEGVSPGVFSGEDARAELVVGIDWSAVTPEELEQTAHLLVDRLQVAEDAGRLPRRVVQIDVGHSPGIALSRTLARYWNAWRVQQDVRIHFVQAAPGVDVSGCVDVLLGGAFDGVHGQVFEVRT